MLLCAWASASAGAGAQQDAVARCGAAGLDRAVACLLDSVPPAELEEALFAEPRLAAAVMPIVADAVMAPAPDARLPDYLASMAQARTRRLTALGSWDELQGEMCLRLQLVDAGRFVDDPAFRARVLAFLPRAFDTGASPALRDQLLASINAIPGVDYAASEAIEWGWGAIPRRSLPREAPYRRDAIEFPDDAGSTIAASIFSFPGPFLEPADVIRFMRAMRAARPERTLVALVDLPMRTAIGDAAHESGWTLVETHGRAFSPWPRDPFSVLRRPDGGSTFLVRPNIQPERPFDNEMALDLIQGVPVVIDDAWGNPTWMESPAPFHNGLILLSKDAAWISVHSVAERAMALLGRKTMSAEELARPEEWRRHRDAVMTAAGELQDLYKRPVRLVHPLPDSPDAAAVADVVAGGGFDLDSLVTVLPQPDGTVRALVADVALGTRMLAEAPDEELARFAATYRLKPGAPAALRTALAAMQQAPRAAALAGFLDRIAAHLKAQTAGVERVPLLFVDVASLADAPHLEHHDFQLTWNNVVLETAAGAHRAEGFASGLDAMDRAVAATFARAGYQLDYVPVLPDSVILLGGYRCASQHVRQQVR